MSLIRFIQISLMTIFMALPAFTSAQGAEKLKVGFIYAGPIGDYGWAYQHNQGRLAVEQAFGDKVETLYMDNVSPGKEAETAIEKIANQGAKLIFTTSFGYLNATLKMAKKYPDVKFETVTRFKRTDNLSTYASRLYEGRYVMGQIAAKMSKSGVAGYIASLPVPSVIRGINAFMLGAQSVKPDFKLNIKWVRSFLDPKKEEAAAKELIGQGADILVQHTDSVAPLMVARKNGILAFGKASDLKSLAPKTQLTSLIENWAEYYIARTKAVLDDNWTSTDSWGGIDSKMVGLADFDNMPENVKKMAKKTVQEIKDGTRHVFQGPIYKQNGTLAVEAGQNLSDKQLLGLSWYVKGIENKLHR